MRMLQDLKSQGLKNPEKITTQHEWIYAQIEKHGFRDRSEEENLKNIYKSSFVDPYQQTEIMIQYDTVHGHEKPLKEAEKPPKKPSQPK